ncbi:hypothetical protein WME73_36265 [Sorangium sp. So ce302]|uniref:hypothetical protein n=1 Tax=Sorangium sp. So ce302 TaxID=3133297 RepID=UPI003F6161D6
MPVACSAGSAPKSSKDQNAGQSQEAIISRWVTVMLPAEASLQTTILSATEARSELLRCRRATECEKQCEEMRALPACRDAMSTVLRCFASKPTPRWECGDGGSPSVKEG